MSQPTEELKPYRVRDLHRAGIYLDTYPASGDIPPNGFIQSKNTRFRQGAVEVVPGWSPFGSPVLDSRVMHGDQLFLQNGSDFLIAVSETSPWTYNAGLVPPWSQVTPSLFTGGPDNFYDSDTIFNNFVITNNKDPIYKWPGSGAFVPLGGLATAFPNGSVSVSQALLVRSFGGFAVLLGTSENGISLPQRIRWSKQGFLEVWDNDVNGNGQAGFYDLTDTPDFIMNSEALSGALLIMKERSFWTMQYVGLPAIWFFRRVVTGIGLVAQRAFVNMGDDIIFLGPDNFYAFGGYNLTEIGDSRTKNTFFHDLNPSFTNRIQAFIIEEEDEIHWLYPSVRAERGVGEIDTAIVWNYITKSWSFKQAASTHWFYYIQFADYTWQTIPNLPWIQTVDSWNSRRLISQFPINLFGMPDGSIQQYGTVYSQNGAAYDKIAETKLTDFDLPDTNKRLERVSVTTDRNFSGTIINVYVGHCASPGDPITYSGPFTINCAVGKPRYFTCDITDVLFDLKFETPGAGDAWRVMEYVFWFREKSYQ